MERFYKEDNNSYIITPSGYLDLYNLPEIKETTEDISESDVIIECSDLRYMDSAVIKYFAELSDSLKRTGNRLVFVDLKDYIKDIVDMVQLTDRFVFEYREDEEK